MSAETWEKTLRIFQSKKLIPTDREESSNPSSPKQEQTRRKPTTNIRVDDSILEQVYELLPDSATPLEEVAESICQELNLTVDQLIQAVINLEQDSRVLVESGSGQVIVMRSP